MFREGLFFPLTSWLLKPKVPWRTALASLRRRPDASARRETGDAGKRGEREGAALGLERREPGVGGMVVHGRFCAKGNVCAEPIRWPWALSPLSWTLTVAASHSPFAFPPSPFFTLQLGLWMCVSVLNRLQRRCWNEYVWLEKRKQNVWNIWLNLSLKEQRTKNCRVVFFGVWTDSS